MQHFRLGTVLLAAALSGCIASKRSTDKAIARQVTRNVAFVKEAAEFAVSVTYNKPETSFWAKDVADKRMQRKIASLGNEVRVTYNGSQDEIPDSTVTFRSMTLFGVTEIIYDFAAAPRQVPANTKNRKDYYFVKLAERIYYRRTPVPMM